MVRAHKWGCRKITKHIDPNEVMNVEQPSTISIDGVEVPSWYFVWRKLQEYERRLFHMRAVIAVEGAVIMALLLGLILK